MKTWLKHGWFGVLFCASCILRLLRWTLWLALVVLLGVQLWIAFSRELAVPGYVLRMFEERLAASNVQLKFGRAQFDPSGGILLENVQLSLPAYREPIAITQSAYVEFDPWALLGRRLEVHRLHLSGARFSVPAMLSHSGQAEDIVHDLNATLRLGQNEIIIENLTARVAGIATVIHGGVHLMPTRLTGAEPLPVANLLSVHYPDLCRQVIRITERLTALDQPELHLTLTPSNTRGAIAAVTVTARGLKLADPVPIAAQGIHLVTRFPLQGDTPVMSPLSLSVDQLSVGDVTLRSVDARLRGALHPAQYTYDPHEVQLAAAQVSTHGFTLDQLSTRIDAGPLPRLKGRLIAAYHGLPLSFEGEADLTQKTAALRFDGQVSPRILEPIGQAIHHDVRPYIGFGRPIVLDGRATFAPGWKFTKFVGHVLARQVDAYHVPIDEGGGDVEFDGVHFLAHHAFARLGPNLARGSFEQDFSDLRFRFLLEGHLRPLAISGWFGKWWPAFFDDFEFPLAPPDASVDVAGEWKQGRLTTVFVYANSAEPVVHGVKFDHMRTLIFIRPNFFDGLELVATQGDGMAHGTFTRQIEPSNYALVGMDLDFESTLPLEVPVKIFGSAVADQLSPFRFASPPSMKIKARFDGPASPAGPHQWMRLQAQSSGEFAFNNFPLGNLAFAASVRDDEVTIDNVTVNFAGGVVSGKARLWGHDNTRRLGFDLALRDASLGQAVRDLEEFSSRRKGVPTPPPGKFVQDKASVKVNLAASAEGFYSDPFSFKGDGHATLEGASLGEVHMLGLLSELLSFTSLRFTAARANLRIDGSKLYVSDLTATGANSAIEARGTYELREQALDFKARVNPFQESTFLPSILLGAVLTPFASVLEVKLTGSLEKPEWSFVNGPTNFFRNLTKPAAPSAAEKPPAGS